MEKELNIAEILKDKPLDIKLWTDIFGEVTLDYVSKNGNGFNVKHHHGVLDKFLSNGKIYDEGTLCIYPSKSMRDWSKFAWKKGDVLVSDNNKVFVVYNRFANEDYTMFKISYVGYKDGNIGSNDSFYNTADYHKVSKEDAKEFIKSIEVQFGGKLNLSTLEIEKPQFKDGDIVVTDYVEGVVFICICNKVEDNFMYCHARMNSHNKDLYLKKAFLKVNLVNRNPRPATNSEKRQLFSALEKKGKRWDTKKKAIVDLPKKCEFKPKDWCLMKYKGHYNNRGWELCQYAYTEHRVSSCGESRDFYHSVGGAIYAECIPYNDQTAHLLGTNDDYAKGGEE